MEKAFQIISDSSCDLPPELAAEKDIRIVPFYVSFDGEEYKKEIEEISVRDFYQRMVDNPKSFPKSSMPGVPDYEEAFLPYAKEGVPIICICITAKFSSSIQSAELAKESVLDKYPDAKIAVIDARINTVLQGLYVLEAAKLCDRGETFENSVKRLKEIRQSGRIFFTVGSIDYLQSGGRIGKVAKAVSGVLNVRPIITLKEGEIFPSGIARSRKKSVAKSLDLLRKHVRSTPISKETYVFDIGYGYDIEEAKAFQEDVLKMLAEEGIMLSQEDIPLYQIGSGIGVHTGPYALGVTVLERA